MSPYVCRSCSSSFQFVEEALDHQNRHHSKIAKGCVVPGCCYQKNEMLSRHTRRRHRSSCQYSCSSCSEVFVRAADRNQHATDVHRGLSSDYVTAAAFPTWPRWTPPSFHLPGSLDGLTGYLSTLNITGRNEGKMSNKGSQEAIFNLARETTSTNLNRFIHAELQSNESFNSEMSNAVDSICRFFQARMHPGEIFKGGSMGKGTAIKRNTDIDLLLILPRTTAANASELRDKLPALKERIEGYLRGQELRGFTVLPETIQTTRFSVQFTVKGGGEEIKVDLLPTFAFTDKAALYRQMANGPGSLIPFYHASLAKLQVPFVESVPPNVKDLIRLVKYWRKNYVDDNSTGGRNPNSYVLELISIHLWEEKQKPGQFHMLKAFHSVMEALANPMTIRAFWTQNYCESMIPMDIREQKPLVVDPANPFNNVCYTFNWDAIQRKAREALQKPMLRNVSSVTWN